MTTVAYRDGVIASDSRLTGKEYLWTDRCQKVFRLADGSIVGLAGDDYNGNWLLSELRKLSKITGKKTLPNGKFKGAQAILLTTRGRVFTFAYSVWDVLPHKQFPYYAIGSGSTIAMSAMDAGATAVEAVNIAKKRDVYSGGRTQKMEVK